MKLTHDYTKVRLWQWQGDFLPGPTHSPARASSGRFIHSSEKWWGVSTGQVLPQAQVIMGKPFRPLPRTEVGKVGTGGKLWAVQGRNRENESEQAQRPLRGRGQDGAGSREDGLWSASGVIPSYAPPHTHHVRSLSSLAVVACGHAAAKALV